MPVQEETGDLFDADEATLAHGCNCAGVMGKGIAIEFRRRWPAMFHEYREKCLTGDFQPGDVFAWADNGRTILNLGTQQTWRTKARPADVNAAFEQMINYAQANNIRRIAMPRIAAGLGGLNWPDVRAILDRATPEDIDVIVYSPAN